MASQCIVKHGNGFPRLQCQHQYLCLAWSQIVDQRESRFAGWSADEHPVQSGQIWQAYAQGPTCFQFLYDRWRYDDALCEGREDVQQTQLMQVLNR